jgi:hypothetical protein
MGIAKVSIGSFINRLVPLFLVVCRITLECSPTHSVESTAAEIAIDFTEALSEYEVDLKNVSAIVTDTEPTMNAFGRIMMVDKGVYWVGCVDHILELVTGIACNDTKTGVNDGCMKAGRKLVGHFRHSNQQMESLRKRCNPLSIRLY